MFYRSHAEEIGFIYLRHDRPFQRVIISIKYCTHSSFLHLEKTY